MSIRCISKFWQHMKKNRRSRQPLHDRDVGVENQTWHARDILHPLWMRGVICVVAQNEICLLLFQTLCDMLPDLSQTAEAGGHSNRWVLIWLFLKSDSLQLIFGKKGKKTKSLQIYFWTCTFDNCCTPARKFKLRIVLMLRALANKGANLWNWTLQNCKMTGWLAGARQRSLHIQPAAFVTTHRRRLWTCTHAHSASVHEAILGRGLSWADSNYSHAVLRERKTTAKQQWHFQPCPWALQPQLQNGGLQGIRKAKAPVGLLAGFWGLWLRVPCQRRVTNLEFGQATSSAPEIQNFIHLLLTSFRTVVFLVTFSNP